MKKQNLQAEKQKSEWINTKIRNGSPTSIIDFYRTRL